MGKPPKYDLEINRPDSKRTLLCIYETNDRFQYCRSGDRRKIPEMVMETFMNQEKMYMKLPEQEDWLVQDLPFSPEFWKQQQDIQSDP